MENLMSETKLPTTGQLFDGNSHPRNPIRNIDPNPPGEELDDEEMDTEELDTEGDADRGNGDAESDGMGEDEAMDEDDDVEELDIDESTGYSET
jgi:hypothetical protein